MINLFTPPVTPRPDFPEPSQLISYEMPVGSVISFAGNLQGSAAAGQSGGFDGHPTVLDHSTWKVCDGSKLLREEYPELFNTLGYLYGGEHEKFCLPNLQGMFIRGVDPTQGSPANENRQSIYSGDSYIGVGSVQPYAMRVHQHNYTKQTQSSPGNKGTAYAQSSSSTNTSGPIDKGMAIPSENQSETELRPVNVYLYFLIKCKADERTITAI